MSQTTMILIKKYSNRRLYDTSRSQYITLDQLSEHIRQGEEVQVQDAKTGDDLTQSVLAQVVMEGRGAAKMLPTSMLMELIRMEDDALSEFFGHYMAWALSFYIKARQSARGGFSPPSPFGGAQSESFVPWFQAMTSWSPMGQPPSHPGWPGASPADRPPPPHVPGASVTQRDDVATMRAELDEIKALLKEAVSPKKP